MRLTKLLGLFVVVFVLLAALPFGARADSVILTLAVPEYMSDVFKPDLFTKFETDHPGVKVVIKTISPDLVYYPPANDDVEKHLDSAAKYTAAGDVLYINSYNLSLEATRAGLFLNLLPLVNADKNALADDFIPAAWQSYQWDQGMWALPVSLDVTLLMYDPEAFDKAGVAYPTDHWTLDDLAAAARTLAKKDSTGKVIQPALIYTNVNAFLRSAIGEPLYDPNVQPNPPQLDKPSVVRTLESWAKLEAEGVVGGIGPKDPNDVPMRIDMSYRLFGIPGADRKVMRGALLPGGKAGMSADGFAISGATQYPDQAYALLQYLTGQVNAASRFFGIAPARKSLVGVEPGAGVPRAIRNFTPENQAAIDTALANLLPVSELRFTDYLWIALSNIRSKKMDVQTALQDVQSQAIKALQTASARRGTKVLAVATPIPTPVLQKDQVSLKFNMIARYLPLPNRDQWDRVIKEFTSTDPQVKQIVFDTSFGTTIKDIAEKYDCFYLPYASLSTDDISHVLNLDPLLSADPKFDRNDFVGGVLTQVQRDNKTWAYPFEIMPQALLYDSGKFAKANVPSPENTWSIDNFVDALKALKAITPDDPAFASSSFGNMHLMMLIAAYGGLPMDYRADPPTVNFTDPANVDAIRQVLDLAKKGYIKYDKLFSNSSSMTNALTNAIHTISADGSLSNFRRPELENAGYKIISYPRGTRYTPLVYDVGMAYISNSTPNIEACYRWITTIASHPELLNGMPARRSLLNSPAMASQNPGALAFYKSYDALMTDPNAIILASPFANRGGFDSFVVGAWLNRVFDRYVLQDANLENELQDAQTLAKAYQGCTANLPPFTGGTATEIQAYYKQYTDCAIKVDPSLKSMFGQ